MITRGKEGHLIMIKRSIYHEDIIIINIYSPINRATKYTKQNLKEFKGEIHNSTK